MTTHVVTVTRRQSLWEAWSLMSSCGVRHIAVTEDGHCVGVLDDRQLVAAWRQGLAAMESIAVDRVVDRRITSVLPETLVGEIVAIMSRGSVDAVPVVDDYGVMLGLLTANDVVRAVARWSVHADVASSDITYGTCCRDVLL